MKLHIIYTETELLLSKRPYASWRDIQDVHPDFKTSLGPWRDADVVAYLADEHPDLSPAAIEQVEELLRGSEETIALRFAVDRQRS